MRYKAHPRRTWPASQQGSHCLFLRPKILLVMENPPLVFPGISFRSGIPIQGSGANGRRLPDITAGGSGRRGDFIGHNLFALLVMWRGSPPVLLNNHDRWLPSSGERPSLTIHEHTHTHTHTHASRLETSTGHGSCRGAMQRFRPPPAGQQPVLMQSTPTGDARPSWLRGDMVVLGGRSGCFGCCPASQSALMGAETETTTGSCRSVGYL